MKMECNQFPSSSSGATGATDHAHFSRSFFTHIYIYNLTGQCKFKYVHIYTTKINKFGKKRENQPALGGGGSITTETFIELLGNDNKLWIAAISSLVQFSAHLTVTIRIPGALVIDISQTSFQELLP